MRTGLGVKVCRQDEDRQGRVHKGGDQEEDTQIRVCLIETKCVIPIHYRHFQPDLDCPQSFYDMHFYTVDQTLELTQLCSLQMYTDYSDTNTHCHNMEKENADIANNTFATFFTNPVFIRHHEHI